MRGDWQKADKRRPTPPGNTTRCGDSDGVAPWVANRYQMYVEVVDVLTYLKGVVDLYSLYPI